MKFKKIKVDAVLFYNNGTRERKEFEFEKLGKINQSSLIQYITDNTTNCVNVVIIDVWHEIE